MEEIQEQTQEQEIVESYNIHDPYECKLFTLPDPRVGQKQCRCGRLCLFRDRFCGTCGQKLVIPDF